MEHDRTRAKLRPEPGADAADDRTRLQRPAGNDGTPLQHPAGNDGTPLQHPAEDDRTRLQNRAADDKTRLQDPAARRTTPPQPPAADARTRLQRPRAEQRAGAIDARTAGTTPTGSDWRHPERWESRHEGPLGPGSVIKDRFVLESVLGQGGMGVCALRASRCSAISAFGCRANSSLRIFTAT